MDRTLYRKQYMQKKSKWTKLDYIILSVLYKNDNFKKCIAIILHNYFVIITIMNNKYFL